MDKAKDSDGMEPGAIALRLGIEALKRTLPAGISWVSDYVRGVNLLIVGPSASGKTTFSDYLVYGLLDPEADHITTLEEEKSPVFTIEVGKNNTLKLKVRKLLDEPGQIGPVAHANLVKTQRPHAILVILDVSETAEYLKAWVGEFCENLERVLREDKRLVKKIRSFIVVLNKKDKVSIENHFISRKKTVKKSVVDGLGPVLGRQQSKTIPIMPCVSVLTEHGTTLIDSVISTLAKQVAA